MFDSHAHMCDNAFSEDRKDVIRRVFESGVTGWMEVGTSAEESKQVLALAQTDERIVASVGVHPHEIASIADGDWAELSELADNEKVKAIGEVGLDFSRIVIPDPIGDPGDVDSRFRGNDSVGKEIAFQEAVLRRFIALAQEKHLPVIYHVRSGNAVDAHAELIRIISSYSDDARPRGVIHTFSGTLSQAQEYVRLGMMISFSGVITFKNAGELPEVAKTIPLESIVVETDCPYLTPEPYRGKRNDPSLVKYVIQKIADLRGDASENIAKITLNNAKILFSV